MKSRKTLLYPLLFLCCTSVAFGSGAHIPRLGVAGKMITANSGSSTILMPIEVMGASGFTRSVEVNIPSSANLAGSVSLSLQIHGLEYQTQASVQVNNSSWIALNSSDIKIQGLGQNYGGIGGGFSTLTMLVNLPAGVVQLGNNTVAFRFNGTDGNSSGYRVLAFNFRAANGVQLIPGSEFVQDNPAAWVPPSKSASDIAAGRTLYQTAAITQPVPGSEPSPLNAHCGDCHTKDGRDLKYFNYSNNSIYQRALFHGLDSTQANQIVSYIRSLSTPAPPQARPWNPPYQPGPAVDSQPVVNWAAGAGLNAVLPSDAAMLPYVAPTKTSADFNLNGYINIRDTPIAYQLLDWNHWLPRVHPTDAYGSSFLSSAAFADYNALLASLIPNSASSYQANQYVYNNWALDTVNFRSSVQPPRSSSEWANSRTAESVYGVQQWQMVKLWEVNQTFGLEGMAQDVFGSQADSRAWYTNAPFQSSPSISQIPPGAPGIHNGSVTTFNNVSFLWYYLQFILNDGNKRQENTGPVDYGYFYGFISTQGEASGPQAMIYLTVLGKALQLSENGYGPQYGGLLGWQWAVNDASFLANAADVNNRENIWSGLPVATRVSLINAYMTQWLAAVQQFSPQQFYEGGTTSPTDPINESWYGSYWAGRVAFMLPHLKFEGMSSTLTSQIAAWAQTMWPGYKWSVFADATCSANSGGYVICSSDSLL